MSSIKVSICVLAYNHERYLRQALDSFIAQKTTFAFEVIVHDDHSTDGTRQIIEEYAASYPNIIVPIYQSVNRFPEHGISGIYRDYIYPKTRGEYIAYCEGDDFWKSPEKLQKQVQALEAHPECRMCLHFTRSVDERGDTMDWGYPQKEIATGVLKGIDFLSGLTDGYFFHTTSFMCRKSDLIDMTNHLPEYYKVSDVDDVPLLLYMGQLGDVYYINEELTCYRRNSIGSWTEGQSGNVDKIVKHKLRMVELYERYDTFTQGRFHNLVLHWINNEKFMIAEWTHDFKEMVKSQYQEFLNKRSLKFKIRVYVAARLKI